MAKMYENERALDTEALKGLAHPLRIQLLDALSGYGPATASALAERLGESSGATSYHLRQLEKHGFVEEDTTRGSGRERWWQRVPRPISLDPVSDDPGPAEKIASNLVLAEWQRTRESRLHAYLEHGLDTLGKDWVEGGGISTANVQLTLEQMRELTDELAEVMGRYLARYRNQRAVGARPVQVHIDVFPLVDGVEQTAGDVGGDGKDQD